MNRDIFKRGIRFTHKFGGIEQIDDPLGRRTFDFKAEQERTRVSELSKPAQQCTVQQYGEYAGPWGEPRSPVQLPSGRLASTNGPEPDEARMYAVPVPASTRKRVSGRR